MSDETKPDGGPAYPCDWKDFQPTTGEQVVREQYQGMSLRAYFAGQAMSTESLERAYHCSPKLLAEWCVKYADALIAELNKP